MSASTAHRCRGRGGSPGCGSLVALDYRGTLYPLAGVVVLEVNATRAVTLLCKRCGVMTVILGGLASVKAEPVLG